jgi:hypothetical protein
LAELFGTIFFTTIKEVCMIRRAMVISTAVICFVLLAFQAPSFAGDRAANPFLGKWTITTSANEMYKLIFATGGLITMKQGAKMTTGTYVRTGSQANARILYLGQLYVKATAVVSGTTISGTYVNKLENKRGSFTGHKI